MESCVTPEPNLSEARALLRPEATLAELVTFTHRYDPTAAFRAKWGTNFEKRRDYLKEKCQDMIFLGKEFPGTKSELVLCMVDCVATAPYLGSSEDAVRRYLRQLLLELTSDC